MSDIVTVEGPINPNELTILTESVIGQCRQWYGQFDSGVWNGNKNNILRSEFAFLGPLPSFHNVAHLDATIESSSILIEAARAGNDPLGLLEDLRRWNHDHPGSHSISPEEFALLVKVAFACHDLGNIMTDLDNFGKPIYRSAYSAENAETISMQLAEKIISQWVIDPARRTKYIALVRDLIDESRYIDPSSGVSRKPFTEFMKVVDRIGNDLFNREQGRIIGLLLENHLEKPGSEYSADTFLNFTRDQITRFAERGFLRRDIFEQLFQVWGKRLPQEVKGFSRKKRPVTEIVIELIQVQNIKF